MEGKYHGMNRPLQNFKKAFAGGGGADGSEMFILVVGNFDWVGREVM